MVNEKPALWPKRLLIACLLILCALAYSALIGLGAAIIAHLFQ